MRRIKHDRLRRYAAGERSSLSLFPALKRQATGLRRYAAA
jgi:hypothetical protein